MEIISAHFRYFILFNDGALLGFKAKPKLGQPFPEPLNDFMVKDAQAIRYEKPRPNMFMIRVLQWTTVIERTFYAETAEVRNIFSNTHTPHQSFYEFYCAISMQLLEIGFFLAIEFHCSYSLTRQETLVTQHMSEEPQPVPEEMMEVVSQASMDDLSGQYAGAAHAIMGQPSIPANSGANALARTEMMSIADTSDAAKRDKIVNLLYRCL
ncbi:unnamed protein product [Strongylus vulgaris]|uniref:PH domain-containing protein n=1 Tax=Strongylus vulgaris TaxID=40348 RepID=A0A3P7KNF8_STRVU|nr:unnamed protein product [Strongylus vulgaris]